MTFPFFLLFLVSVPGGRTYFVHFLLKFAETCFDSTYDPSWKMFHQHFGRLVFCFCWVELGGMLCTCRVDLIVYYVVQVLCLSFANLFYLFLRVGVKISNCYYRILSPFNSISLLRRFWGPVFYAYVFIIAISF